MMNFRIWENLSLLGKLRFCWICYNDTFEDNMDFKAYAKMTAQQYLENRGCYQYLDDLDKDVESFDDFMNYLVEVYMLDGYNPAEIMEKVFKSF